MNDLPDLPEMNEDDFPLGEAAASVSLDRDQTHCFPSDFRERETVVPDEVEDEIPTSRRHDIPSFVGTPPSEIPSAPPYFREFMTYQRERDERRDAELSVALQSVNDLAKQIMDGTNALVADVRLLREAVVGDQQENQIRHGNHERRDRELASDMRKLNDRCDLFESQIRELRGEIARLQLREDAEVA